MVEKEGQGILSEIFSNLERRVSAYAFTILIKKRSDNSYLLLTGRPTMLGMQEIQDIEQYRRETALDIAKIFENSQYTVVSVHPDPEERMMEKEAYKKFLEEYTKRLNALE